MTTEFPYSTQVSCVKDPLTWTNEKRELMVNACREMAIFHYKNCPEIKGLYDKYSFDPQSIKSESDLERIPMLGVAAMKWNLITSLPYDHAVLKLTSSGTRGQKTQIWFDQDSLDRVQKMLDVYLEQEGLVSKQKHNYLVFSYDPDDAKDLGVAYTEKNQLRFAPVDKVLFAIKKDQAGEWQFNKEGALKVLCEYMDDEIPTRILGMPAFIFEFIKYMDDQKISIQLPQGSVMITGGGWKAAEEKSITREELRNICHQKFGIIPTLQRDAYGMAEHSAPYFECKNHKFHVAVFNRLIMRDPNTMEALPPGEKGLLELITPYNAMMPNLALLSTDWAMIDKEPCECGANAPTFTLLGRAGISKHKGCALHAEDIVKRSKKS